MSITNSGARGAVIRARRFSILISLLMLIFSLITELSPKYAEHVQNRPASSLIASAADHRAHDLITICIIMCLSIILSVFLNIILKVAPDESPE